MPVMKSVVFVKGVTGISHDMKTFESKEHTPIKGSVFFDTDNRKAGFVIQRTKNKFEVCEFNIDDFTYLMKYAAFCLDIKENDKYTPPKVGYVKGGYANVINTPREEYYELKSKKKGDDEE